jgi:alpha-tubulin suppressor-like RCC1 family protein
MMPDTCSCFKGYKGERCLASTYGFAYAAGDDSVGQLADRHVGNDVYETTPIYSGGLFRSTIADIATSSFGSFTLFLQSNGLLFSVGQNTYGNTLIFDINKNRTIGRWNKH